MDNYGRTIVNYGTIWDYPVKKIPIKLAHESGKPNQIHPQVRA